MKKILLILPLLSFAFLINCKSDGISGNYICNGGCPIKELSFSSGSVNYTFYGTPYNARFDFGDSSQGKIVSFNHEGRDLILRVEDNGKQLRGLFFLVAGRIYVKSN